MKLDELLPAKFICVITEQSVEASSYNNSLLTFGMFIKSDSAYARDFLLIRDPVRLILFSLGK